jgi:hypothetical protein
MHEPDQMNQLPQPTAPHPSLNAMLACDRAIRDPVTRKVALVGVFDRIGIPRLPADYVSGMSIYARLTDAQGRYRLRLELVRLDDDQVIGRGEMDATLEDRLRMTEVTLNLKRVRFETAGTYEFRLFGNDRYVGGLTLTVETAAPSLELPADAPTAWWWISPPKNR